MPLLIALKGHPGCGKSAIAHRLGSHLKIPVIDKDDIKDLLVGYPDPGGLAYVTMFRIAHRQLLLGLPVICDSPLSEDQGYAAARRIATETNAGLVVIECICSSPKIWRQRIEQRGALGEPAHNIASWSDLKRHLTRRSESSRYSIDAPYLVVDTVHSLDQVMNEVLTWIAPHVAQTYQARGYQPEKAVLSMLKSAE
ncbi:MAG: ATP-binding protein [Chloroflexales bacterium]|nr:ATP-binding protein [Chloroflexales bacterium]